MVPGATRAGERMVPGRATGAGEGAAWEGPYR